MVSSVGNIDKFRQRTLYFALNMMSKFYNLKLILASNLFQTMNQNLK